MSDSRLYAGAFRKPLVSDPVNGQLVRCSRCDGNGEIQVGGTSINPYTGVRVHDPQMDDVVACAACGGTGVA